MFSVFYAGFCCCPKSVIITTLKKQSLKSTIFGRTLCEIAFVNWQFTNVHCPVTGTARPGASFVPYRPNFLVFFFFIIGK